MDELHSIKVLFFINENLSIFIKKIHPWNWYNFNAKNLWSWQLANASMPM
jgi:hypothetical protein